MTACTTATSKDLKGEGTGKENPLKSVPQDQNQDHNPNQNQNQNLSIDSVAPILKGLPFEVQRLIWKKVILINLTTSQLCKLFNINSELDSILISILVESEFQLDLLQGIRLLPRKYELPFMPIRSTEVHPFMQFCSDEFNQLVEFLKSKNVQVSKASLGLRNDCQMPIVENLQDLLSTCCKEVHVEQRCHIRPNSPNSAYFASATSCSLYDYYDCYHILETMDHLVHLDIGWYGDYPERPEAVQGLIGWADKKCPNSYAQKRLTVKLVLIDQPPMYILNLLGSLAERDIQLQIDVDYADEDIVQLVQSLEHNVTLLQYYLNDADEDNSKWVERVNKLSQLRDLQLRWSFEFDSDSSSFDFHPISFDISSFV
ncbi:unnamed protein product [Ambrosiozyma monospora]|uniref:Unnamed protein product n=1 Tax=Ambrosiozyma monospora TaxID=43982 RepID=A0A9W6YXN6_AMBMO|nr:unnamed protein product [Ambrosiozyma monospora]